MIQITNDIRNDLTDLDNISNLLNYAVNSTINKHYSNKTGEEKLQISKDIIAEFIHGEANVISNNPCPISYPEDKENGINGLRDLLKTVDPLLIKHSILNANILSHAYNQKLGGKIPHEDVSKIVTDITYAGILDENIDKLFQNENILSRMVTNYVDMTFNDNLLDYNRVVTVAYSDPRISNALEQLNSEQYLDKSIGNIR